MFFLVSVAKKTGLRLALSETPKTTGFVLRALFNLICFFPWDDTLYKLGNLHAS